MTVKINQDQFHVTTTQKLIVAKALQAATQRETTPDDLIVDDLARMMVIIQRGRMDRYFNKGFEWSLRSRWSTQPDQVEQDKSNADDKAEAFRQSIEQSTGVAARRIRANRVRAARQALEEQRIANEEWEREQQRRERRALAARRRREARRALEAA